MNIYEEMEKQHFCSASENEKLFLYVLKGSKRQQASNALTTVLDALIDSGLSLSEIYGLLENVKYRMKFTVPKKL